MCRHRQRDARRYVQYCTGSAVSVVASDGAAALDDNNREIEREDVLERRRLDDLKLLALAAYEAMGVLPLSKSIDSKN